MSSKTIEPSTTPNPLPPDSPTLPDAPLVETISSDFARDTPMTEKHIDLGEIQDLAILNENGDVDAALDPNLPDAELLKIHRAMVLTRKLDIRMLNMQRQGEMGTFAPSFGQEATQIGQIYPLQKSDWFSPSYRSFGAQLWRGWTIEQLLLLWDGFFEGFAPPEGVNDLPFSIVIGSQVPLATGIAMGMRNRKDESFVLVNFGDGAFSQGIIAESMNFAAVYKSPIVFVVENNGYAISTKSECQAGIAELARRGPGFGIRSIRVDGNDVLAMIAATQRAADHARSGKGPFLIEAVTYRMSLHTTADDPKVYRSDDEVEAWKAKCPIARFETYLKKKKLLDDAATERIASECEQEVLDAREVFRKKAIAKPREVFDYMYESLSPELQEQQADYFAKLDRKGVE